MGLERLLWCVTCPNQTSFRLLTIAKKRFLRTNKEVDLAPHPVVGLVLQVGEAEKLPQALGLESLDPFLGAGQQDPCLTAMDEDGDEKRLVQSELARP